MTRNFCAIRHAGPLARAFMLITLWLVPGTAHAGKAILGDSGGGTPTPIQGSGLEVSFNPTVRVTVQPQERLAELLLRLAEAINEASAGLYTAAPAEPGAIEIFKAGGGEIDDLRFAENDGAIQSVTLTLARPELIAQVRGPQEEPTAGVIVLTLNDRSFAVEVSGLGAAAATDALLQAILRAGFMAEVVPPFILVRRDLRTGRGIDRVGWRSTDAAIVSSDLALVPDPDAAPLIPAVGPGAALVLAALLALAGFLILRRPRAPDTP